MAVDEKTIERVKSRIQASKKKSPLGLGGMIKAGLSAIGITEERVSKAIGNKSDSTRRDNMLRTMESCSLAVNAFCLTQRCRAAERGGVGEKQITHAETQRRGE